MFRRISLWRRDRCRGGARFVVLGLIEAAITLHAQPPDILWTRLYNAPGIEVPQGITEMADGGFAICSYQFDSTNNIEALIRRVSSNGIVEWTYPFGGPFPYPCAAQAIIETSDGGLLAVGRYDTSEVMGVFALKLTFAGQPVWARFFLGTEFNTGVAVVETEDGGYAIAGIQVFDVPLHIDGRLLKLDYEGNLLWTGYVSQGTNTRTDIDDVALTPDNDYLLYGSTFPLFSNEHHRLLLAKMNNVGDTLWTRIWENPDWDLRARNLIAVPEGGYLLSAAVGDYYGYENYPWLLRLNENGDTLWTRRLDEGYPPSLSFVIVDQVGSDGFIFSGEILIGNIYKSYVARLDVSGNRRWSTTVSHDPDWFGPRAIIGCQTGGYVLLVGFSNPDSAFSALVRFGVDTLTAIEQKPAAVENSQLQQNYPNPFNSTTDIRFDLPLTQRVKLEVFGITGRRMATLADKVLAAGAHHVTFDAAALPSGVYLYRLMAGTESRVQKMVLLK